MLKAGAPVNATNSLKQTPLHSATGSVECLEALLKAGADLEARDFTGDTPLATAVFFQNAKGVEYLIKRGAKVNVKNNLGQDLLKRASGQCKQLLQQAGSGNRTP